MRKTYIDSTSFEGCYKIIPTDYKQSSRYEVNGCVWLSTCLLIRSFDSHLVKYLLGKYKMNCCAYEWLRLYSKEAQGRPNLSTFLGNKRTCYLGIYRLKASKDYSTNMTSSILSGITDGLFIMVLKDTSSGHSYIIGFNRGLNIIYNCVEKQEVHLNHDNISK